MVRLSTVSLEAKKVSIMLVTYPQYLCCLFSPLSMVTCLWWWPQSTSHCGSTVHGPKQSSQTSSRFNAEASKCKCTAQCNPKQFEHFAEVPAPLWGLTLCAPGPLWGLTQSNVSGALQHSTNPNSPAICSPTQCCQELSTLTKHIREVENSEVLPIFLRRSRIVPQSDHLWGWAAQWQVVSVWSSGTESGLTAVFAVKMIGNDSRRQPLGGSKQYAVQCSMDYGVWSMHSVV